MDRIVGIETEYGCLLSEEEPHVNSELWPAKVKTTFSERPRPVRSICTIGITRNRRATEAFFLTVGVSTSTWGTSNTRRRSVCICTILSPTSWLETISCNRH